MKKKIIAIAIATSLVLVSLTGCREATRARHNVQKEADYFNVERRLSVINARTDKPVLEVIGYFSVSNNDDNELVITLETGQNEYKVDYVYLNEGGPSAGPPSAPPASAVHMLTHIIMRSTFCRR